MVFGRAKLAFADHVHALYAGDRMRAQPKVLKPSIGRTTQVDGLFEECVCRDVISLGAQQEVDRSVQVLPLAADLTQVSSIRQLLPTGSLRQRYTLASTGSIFIA